LVVVAQFRFGPASYDGFILRGMGIPDYPHSLVAVVLQPVLATQDFLAGFTTAA
jgi:hypothetical protein